MIKHEHDDHPTYVRALRVHYVGPPVKQSDIYDEYRPESVALIYTDGYVALTLFECCYDLWRLADGAHMGGSLRFKEGWRLTDESIAQARESSK